MWFNILKLDLSQLTAQIQGDADADSINIQRDDKCKKKLLKIIEIMKDTDKKARQALPNILKEVSEESEYKNKDGETIKFKIADIVGEDTIVAENSRYRFGFSVRSRMEDFNNFEEIDEMVACQLLEALKVVLADLDENVSKRKRVKNNEGQEIGRVEYQFLIKGTYGRNKLAIYDTSQNFNVVSISHGAGGYPSSYETFEGYRDFENKLIIELFTQVYEPAFKKIRGML
jgi:hypothetical protein|tara:strand:- start:1690 stop:2379 length:690 start_codon:yes stop_codon:yes gene_type:complete